MKNSKFIAVLFCLSAFFSAAYAGEDVKAGSVKEPSGKNVILVGRITFKTPIDLEARKNAFINYKPTYMPGISETRHFFSIGEITIGTKLWDLEQPFYYTAKVGKDGTARIEFARCCLWGNMYHYFDLPIYVKVAVPEGAKYVYVGNFQYDLDYALRIQGFKHLDEFDDAKKWINRATGKEVELVRGELSAIKDEKK